MYAVGVDPEISSFPNVRSFPVPAAPPHDTAVSLLTSSPPLSRQHGQCMNRCRNLPQQAHSASDGSESCNTAAKTSAMKPYQPGGDPTTDKLLALVAAQTNQMSEIVHMLQQARQQPGATDQLQRSFSASSVADARDDAPRLIHMQSGPESATVDVAAPSSKRTQRHAKDVPAGDGIEAVSSNNDNEHPAPPAKRPKPSLAIRVDDTASLQHDRAEAQAARLHPPTHHAPPRQLLHRPPPILLPASPSSRQPPWHAGMLSQSPSKPLTGGFSSALSPHHLSRVAVQQPTLPQPVAPALAAMSITPFTVSGPAACALPLPLNPQLLLDAHLSVRNSYAGSSSGAVPDLGLRANPLPSCTDLTVRCPTLPAAVPGLQSDRAMQQALDQFWVPFSHPAPAVVSDPSSPTSCTQPLASPLGGTMHPVSSGGGPTSLTDLVQAFLHQQRHQPPNQHSSMLSPVLNQTIQQATGQLALLRQAIADSPNNHVVRAAVDQLTVLLEDAVQLAHQASSSHPRGIFDAPGVQQCSPRGALGDSWGNKASRQDAAVRQASLGTDISTDGSPSPLDKILQAARGWPHTPASEQRSQQGLQQPWVHGPSAVDLCRTGSVDTPRSLLPPAAPPGTMHPLQTVTSVQEALMSSFGSEQQGSQPARMESSHAPRRRRSHAEAVAEGNALQSILQSMMSALGAGHSRGLEGVAPPFGVHPQTAPAGPPQPLSNRSELDLLGLLADMANGSTPARQLTTAHPAAPPLVRSMPASDRPCITTRLVGGDQGANRLETAASIASCPAWDSLPSPAAPPLHAPLLQTASFPPSRYGQVGTGARPHATAGGGAYLQERRSSTEQPEAHTLHGLPLQELHYAKRAKHALLPSDSSLPGPSMGGLRSSSLPGSALPALPITPQTPREEATSHGVPGDMAAFHDGYSFKETPATMILPPAMPALEHAQQSSAGGAEADQCRQPLTLDTWGPADGPHQPSDAWEALPAWAPPGAVPPGVPSADHAAALEWGAAPPAALLPGAHGSMVQLSSSWAPDGPLERASSLSTSSSTA